MEGLIREIGLSLYTMRRGMMRRLKVEDWMWENPIAAFEENERIQKIAVIKIAEKVLDDMWRNPLDYLNGKGMFGIEEDVRELVREILEEAETCT